VKKNSTTKMKRQMARQKLTVGIDLGDRSSRYCILDEQGDVLSEGSFATTKAGIAKLFQPMAKCRIAIETGCHSPWVSRQLTQLGHEVIVANARNVQLISQSTRKDDRLDARTLARLVRIDASLLCPVRHRGAEAQAHLAIIRSRDVLVRTRTLLVNAARGLTKSFGERLRKCGTEQVGLNLAVGLDPVIRAVVEPLLAEVETLNERIAQYSRQIEEIAEEHYPEVAGLKKINGVGTLIALTFVLTVDDPHRFRKSRDVGCYLGLRPGRRNSGNSEPQMHISKEGDSHLRRLMVQGAHYILGAFGTDCDLRRWGLELAERGGKNAKKRAVIAVARKLAILLHKLWVSGEAYDPLRNSNRAGEAVAA
jgi:transposase